jgi:hypothetical protein
MQNFKPLKFVIFYHVCVALNVGYFELRFYTLIDYKIVYIRTFKKNRSLKCCSKILKNKELPGAQVQ